MMEMKKMTLCTLFLKALPMKTGTNLRAIVALRIAIWSK